MKNNYIEKISKYMKSDSKSKIILFFGFYFVFFFFLIMSIRSNSSNVVEKDKYLFSIDNLKNNNYHFQYTLNIDNVKTIYEGDLNKNQELFTVNNIEKYYEENNIYFKYSNGWMNSANPYQVINPRYGDIIEKILDNATYISKTENVDKTKVYNYQITTTTLYKIFDFNDIDLDDMINEIKVYTDEDNDLVKLEFDFSSYYTYKGICTNKLNILMEYSNYGKINELTKE